MFQIHQVEAQADNLEYLGTKRKFWYSEGEARFLFKAEERGTGEDWAEKVVCELARLLGLPHVEYELAHFPLENLPGVICANLAPRPLSLVMGNQLLLVVDKTYPVHMDKKFGSTKHTVEAVANILQMLDPPSEKWMKNAPLEVTTALGAFTGYMLLDAWVANQDRHHQNWGAVVGEGAVALAPTFDHGSSLARNLTDAEREDRLNSTNEKRTVKYFVGRALSEFFPTDGTKPLLLLEVFRKFAALNPIEANAWLKRLHSVTPNQLEAILAQVPTERMTELTRRFTLEMLTLNKIRLLEGYQS